MPATRGEAPLGSPKKSTFGIVRRLTFDALTERYRSWRALRPSGALWLR